MATGLRIKGQDVTLTIVVNGIVQAELTDILSFNCTIALEMIEAAFLGETTTRYDEYFKGSKFDFEMQHHSQDHITFNQAIINRARRITPNTVINVTAVMVFPNGDPPTWTWPNSFFGEIPVNTGSQKDYVKSKYSGACSEPDFGADSIANLTL